ncbi:MAG: PhzF family phenazine biosynthesis protein [Brevundimonas sp.]|uniref:PhzF family phenazine biosynthesis protein n=1 Tax=Brevundimonas sp. TaxID=1871086 RepID=UPI0027334E3F|nr:PhzF family phenazine biosynthesis protein [Brevundimonas sp.]MDP3403287.1 PhzF family phenazine biosynthesis protein [Brevundimonas sp.]
MRQWTIDAFADRPFMGNPAAVVEPFAVWPSDDWMQALAAENNLSETAFLRRSADPARFDLRWFTPTMEVPLCGHATLASAHMLWAELGLEVDALVFDTLSGPLSVRRLDRGYELDFPIDPLTRIGTPPGLAEALGAEPVEVWASRYLIAVMEDGATVRALRPDIRALLAFGEGAMEQGQVIVAALDAGEDHDVVDRFFGPGCGIDEDPATGSARGGLAPLFAAKLGRPIVRFLQAFPGRGARFETVLVGERVLIRGEAVTVIDGCLRL